MDLPKNITQIGEADAKCKIYVEDYVVSFLKQLNPLARDKTMAAALYGRRQTEEDKTYIFVYGAGKLDFIQREVRHLSQAQKQEIEKIRRQYFPEYEFLGYRILDGEMVDGFHVCEQDICRYVSGYAQFYEKNESMLSYMLESRQVEAAPETVDSEKYDMVRERQGRRRARFTEQQKHSGKEQKDAAEGKNPKGSLRAFQGAAAAVFVLLCALGIAMNSSLMEDGKFSLEKLRQDFMEKKLPDDAAVSGTNVQVDTLTTEDKLSQAVQMENNRQPSGESQAGETEPRETGDPQENSQSQTGTEALIPESSLESEESGEQPETSDPEGNSQESQSQETDENEESSQSGEQQDQGGEGDSQEPEQGGEAVPQEPERTTYVVCKGDTLTDISIRTYGNEGYISQICSLNGIQDPDKIKVGQKIILP